MLYVKTWVRAISLSRDKADARTCCSADSPTAFLPWWAVLPFINIGAYEHKHFEWGERKNTRLSFLQLLSENSLWAIRISGRPVTFSSKQSNFIGKKKAPYARSRTTHGSAGFSPQRQHFSGDSLRERHGVPPGERRVGGSAAPPARRGRKRPPPAPSRPAASAESRVREFRALT